MMNYPTPNHNNQRGVALVMSLVFLTLLTILGISSMSTNTLEEKMAYNTRDRTLAFEAAETALRSGEAWIESLAADPGTWANAAKGRYNPDTGFTPVWESVSWSSANVVSYPCNPGDGTPSVSSSCTSGGRTTIARVSTQPKYIIERMGPADSTAPNIITYRITARGTGGTDNAVSMLQSTYAKTF